MFEGLRIDWNLFALVPNEIGSGTNAIIVVGGEGTPEWANSGMSAQEAEHISYYDAMGRMIAGEEG